MLRLLPMSDRDEDIEILALRQQLSVLERQLSKRKKLLSFRSGGTSVRGSAGWTAVQAAEVVRADAA